MSALQSKMQNDLGTLVGALYALSGFCGPQFRKGLGSQKTSQDCLQGHCLAPQEITRIFP